MKIVLNVVKTIEISIKIMENIILMSKQIMRTVEIDIKMGKISQKFFNY